MPCVADCNGAARHRAPELAWPAEYCLRLVDFKVSQGSADKSLIEFKLASNQKLKQNHKNQVAIYEAANETQQSIEVIMFFSDKELQHTQKILQELNLTGASNVVLIDARKDNKPSASTSQKPGCSIFNPNRLSSIATQVRVLTPKS